MKTVTLFISSFLLALNLSAQGVWDTPPLVSKQSSYFDIYLSPEVTCHSSPNGENIRIYDPEGVEIPYIINSESHVDQSVRIKWYNRTGGKYRRRWYTRAYFENPRRDAIEEIVLKVRNADVTQRFWLSGSDDMNHWYIIKEDFYYDAAYDPASTYNLLTLNFPPVDYRYYKVELKHTWREPINIMGAGYYDIRESKGHYQEVKGLTVTQSDDTLGKKSYVEIDLGADHYLDRLHFKVDGPQMYLRNAVLESVSGGGLHESFTISSREVPQLKFDDLRVRKLRLTIDNKDDLPIRIAGVRAYQLKRSITARLEKGVKYQVVLEEEGAPAPEYDLIHFAGELPRNRPRMTLDSARFVPPPAPKVTGEDSVQRVPFEEVISSRETPKEAPAEVAEKEEEVVPLIQSKGVLWGGIIIIFAAMVWFSISLLKDNKSAS